MNQQFASAELSQWIQARQSSLQIAKTTLTRGGLSIDWIPIESQVPGGKIAHPPSAFQRVAEDPKRKTNRVKFELDEDSAEKGPAGTVPVLRPSPVALTRQITLDRFMRKLGGLRVNRARAVKAPADPDPAGYFHNTDSQFGTFYGWEASLNVWQPLINLPAGGNGEDHSILQAWLQNSDRVLQSLEGGWTVDKFLNGDTLPHIFTYYTTNGYIKDGDSLGGYNRMFKGWIQYSGPSTTGRTVFPGLGITAISTFDGPQTDFQLKFQLYKEPDTGDVNWWVAAEGVWMGYYPASLFSKGALGSSVSWVGSGGEIYSSLKNPDETKDQMGSGTQAAAGWQKAAYLRNIKNQTAMDGTMADNAGTAVNDVAGAPITDPYTMQLNASDGDAWGSYFYVGGPDPASEVLASWLTDNVPLPKGIWDGYDWSEKQHSRASNNALIEPPGSNVNLRFVVSNTSDDTGKISFNVAIDRSGSDKTCFSAIGDGSVVGLSAGLAQVGLSLAKANERGFYICEVKGASRPFTVLAEVAE